MNAKRREINKKAPEKMAHFYGTICDGKNVETIEEYKVNREGKRNERRIPKNQS